MRSAKQMLSEKLMEEGLNYIEKKPMENIPKLLNWAEKIAVKEGHKKTIKSFRSYMEHPEGTPYKLIERVTTEIHPNVLKKLLINFFVNAGMVGNPIIDSMKQKYDCNIPWAILMDPTAACNLKCTGCWAAEYNKSDSLNNETLNRIIEEGKELGIHMYIFSGGEPLIRKKDLIEICRKHNDCMFLAFTNATLVDEEFAQELQDVGNFVLAISVEGFEDETDMRRGKNTYQKIIHAMDILKKHGIGFGFSTCYHRYNTDKVGSEEYIDDMIKRGCMFGWYFTYMPLGKDAKLDLMVTPEQREFMYHQVRKFRSNKPIFLLDFWNDGEYVDGCIAGGRNYIHINARGDVEPCAFIHYSNVNIHDVTLLDALKSPLFAEYRKHQPFNENHLRPCPLLDNPNILKEMVHNSQAVSTQPMDKESVDDLTDKCQEAAKAWAKTADELWKKSHQNK